MYKYVYICACVPDDFSGISLTSVVCKVFCLILKERLAVVAEENGLLADEQGRFHKAEVVLSLILLAQTKMALKPEGMLAVFIDFEKVYARVDVDRGYGSVYGETELEVVFSHF